MSDGESYRRLTAYHEAGHAVADARRGSIPARVTIRAAGHRLGGTISIEDWRDGPSARSYVTSLLAGYAAEVRAGAVPELSRKHSDEDFEEAQRVLDLLGEPLDAALKRAQQFVDEPQTWNAIQTVAVELLACGELDDGEVELLIDQADGNPDAAHALDRYRRMSQSS